MNKKRKYRQKRRRGRGLLLGSDWPKIYKNLQPYLRRRKQKGGSIGSIFNWGIKKLAAPNPLSRFLNNPSAGVKFLNRFV